MKVMTVLGTRPEIIRLSRIMDRLDRHTSHVIVHTGQNADPRLKDVFYEEFQLRPPDHLLAMQGTVGEQWATLFADGERLLRDERPDRLLILGDTNSGMIALLARRLGIPVIHLEAGNRCFNDRVPEEVNRRLIDHASEILLPYTEGSRRNLLAEGIPGRRIFVVGNPIGEVLAHYEPQITASAILTTLKLQPQQYFLVTLHRAENVDSPQRLQRLLAALVQVQERFRQPVIVSTHPRTRDRLDQRGIDSSSLPLQFHPPFGFFDFVHLERSARCVLTDSGTVQEECVLAGVPCVTLRHETERPETLECGGNTIAGTEPTAIVQAVNRSLEGNGLMRIPPEYQIPHVSQTVLQIALGDVHGMSSSFFEQVL